MRHEQPQQPTADKPHSSPILGPMFLAAQAVWIAAECILTPS
jgi:hypothetical protein